MENLKEEIVEKIMYLIKNKKNISYIYFDSLFGELEKKIQYQIAEKLEKNNIYFML